jgi:Glyoxalase-like domain
VIAAAGNAHAFAIDHIIAGCRDLAHAVDVIESATGVRAAGGGTHHGKGTRNALLSLGPLRYFEIIAPDPDQPRLEWFRGIADLEEPRLIGWAATGGDITRVAQRLRDAHVAFTGPLAGSRTRPDGVKLEWRTITLADDAGGMLPFFIEWSASSIHPSVTAPAGCELVRFDAADANAGRWTPAAAALGIDLPLAPAGVPPGGTLARLRGTIRGPSGTLEL